MAYVLTDGGSAVVSYPYSIGLLRRDNPNTSFPSSPSNDQLAEWNVFPVTAVEPPPYDPTSFRLAESPFSPQLFDGEWIQVWELVPLTAEEAADAIAQYAASAQAVAESMLRASDVYVLEAFELSKKLHPDFVAYRAALRNPAQLPGYPVSPVFPTTPANIHLESVDLSTDFDGTINS